MNKKRVIIASVVSTIIVILIILYIILKPYIELLGAYNNLKQLESAHLEGSFNIVVDNSSYKVEGFANIKNKDVFADLKVNVLIPVRLNIYSIDGDTYIKNSLDKKWYKEEKKSNGGGSKTKEKAKITKSDIEYKRVDSDKDGMYKFYISINKDKINDYVSVNKDLELYIYVSDSKIKGVKCDMTIKYKDYQVNHIDIIINSHNGIGDIKLPEGAYDAAPLSDMENIFM